MAYKLVLSTQLIKVLNKIDPNPDITIEEKMERYQATKEQIVEVLGKSSREVDDLVFKIYKA